MKPLEQINEMLDFSTHIKTIQFHLNIARLNNNKEDDEYWSECLREMLKVRHTVEIKLYKSKKK